MDWTRIFKSKPKPDPKIRWFGKLPTYPDYYSSPADAEWAVEFNDWVLKGFEVYQSRVKSQAQPVRRLPLAGCVIRLPQSGMTVFSSILDYGGDMRGRPFPICFYAAVPTPLWPGPTSDRLGPVFRVVRDLLALRRDVARFINQPGRFETAFGDHSVDFGELNGDAQDASWKSEGTATRFMDWFEQARSGLKISDAETWARTVHRWGRNLAQHEGPGFEPTLRFPLAMRLPLDLQVAGWMRWLESRMDVRRRLFSLMVSGELDRDSGHLTVIARNVVREDFLLLTSLAHSLPYLDDVMALEADDGSASGAIPADSSWMDFVESRPPLT
ncbi:MAG: DUF2094 domain-containing protein [Planctomycetes bacterium]|nr:DUF2094 domain-containing protein [Planctomycetota bacterium]